MLFSFPTHDQRSRSNSSDCESESTAYLVHEIRITDLLLDVDKATGFTDAFMHLRTGTPCNDTIELLNVVLVEGLNLGLSKMAAATDSHDLFQLARLSRWHVESDPIKLALGSGSRRIPSCPWRSSGERG